MIEATGLVKNFGDRRAVADLSLTVHPGEIYGFLGPNGAGKTTTIRMLLGILRPDAGEVRLSGTVIRRGDLAARRLVGAVGETQHLYPDLSCAEYLRFFADLYGVRRPRVRVAEVLEELALADRARDRAVDLSKGLQQKLGLARALLHDPPVLILDEPESGLDPHGIREVRSIIFRERERGRTVLMSSHVLAEIERTADRVGILSGGRLLLEGETERVTRALADGVRVDVTVDRDTVQLADVVRDVAGVRAVTPRGPVLTIELSTDAGVRSEVSRALTDAGAAILAMTDRHSSLEDAFVALTRGTPTEREPEATR